MRKISIIVNICLILILGGSFFMYVRTPGLAQNTDGVILRVFPEQIQGVVGQNVDVAVEVVDVANLYAIDILVAYDSQVVEVLDQDPDLDGVQVKLGTLLEPGFVIFNLADNSLGRLRLVMTQLNPATPKSGTGALVVITFKGKQASTGSPVEVLSAKLASPAGQEIPVSKLENAALSVLESIPGPTNTPIPAQNPGTPMPTPEPPTPAPSSAELSAPVLTFTPTPSFLDLPAPTATQPVDSTPPLTLVTSTNTLLPAPSATKTSLVMEQSITEEALLNNSAVATQTPSSSSETTIVDLSTSEPTEDINQPAETKGNILVWSSILVAVILVGSGSYIYLRKRRS